MIIKNYTGAKGGQTILPILANHMPKSKRYFSFFLGGGSLEFSRDFKDCKWICSDKSASVQKHFSTSAPGVTVYKSWQQLVENYVFTSDDFIFCDPPYLFETRRTGLKYYQHEFNYENHVEFLDFIGQTQAKVLVTHPKNLLYSSQLSNFRELDFTYNTRNGMFYDCMYMNYNSSTLDLVTYKYLGYNNTDRQRIKRKTNNLITKIKNLSHHERQNLLQQLNLKQL